jgi:hypothetical protein
VTHKAVEQSYAALVTALVLPLLSDGHRCASGEGLGSRENRASRMARIPSASRSSPTTESRGVSQDLSRRLTTGTAARRR